MVANQQQYMPISSRIHASEEHICQGREKVHNIVRLCGCECQCVTRDIYAARCGIVVLHQLIIKSFSIPFRAEAITIEDTENTEEVRNFCISALTQNT